MIVQKISVSSPKYFSSNAVHKDSCSEQELYSSASFKCKKLTSPNAKLFQKLMATFGFFGPGALIIHEMKLKDDKTSNK